MLNSGLVSWRLLHSLESRNPVKSTNLQGLSARNVTWPRFRTRSLSWNTALAADNKKNYALPIAEPESMG